MKLLDKFFKLDSYEDKLKFIARYVNPLTPCKTCLGHGNCENCGGRMYTISKKTGKKKSCRKCRLGNCPSCDGKKYLERLPAPAWGYE